MWESVADKIGVEKSAVMDSAVFMERTNLSDFPTKRHPSLPSKAFKKTHQALRSQHSQARREALLHFINQPSIRKQIFHIITNRSTL